MRVQDNEYTVLSDREIAGTGLGTSPAAVSSYADLQRAVYQDQPADTQVALDTATGAQTSADAADTKAQGAQDTADNASMAAADAGTRADAAQDRADDAYALAVTKVTKDVGPAWAAPTATLSRAALADYIGTAAPTYTQADVQALMDRVSLLTKVVAALVVDGRGNHSLTN